ncbi:hypothetical protein [Flavobacterium sp. NRK F7]|uniref:hypothetical protein n=1 Tax=Flavobacterium sp. NRK F7 TaxID=2954930 RepID=UPI00209051DB|nr:hypothetical protein [Flavobacterium sp. NRK F7]MCO6163006.1 hypothetical protein [Flavobacterium sp. NRK F7]
MKKILFIVTFLISQFNLFSQKEIVGKVAFYKSIESDWKVLESFPNQTIKNLTNRVHSIEIVQNNHISKLETDSTGIFKFKTKENDSIQIYVNASFPLFKEEFEIVLNQIKDTLQLKISDKKISVYRDSINEPQFYAQYNEKQAALDFQNGKKRLLAIAVDWPKEDVIKRFEEIENEYGIKYDYFFEPSREKIRIMYRYNQVMKKLIGINKNVW